ncbi:MAG: hypothetical protein R2712_11365 [Vicinamibacterales bacterium]
MAALTYMAALPHLPLLIANHPSRSATGLGAFGADSPWEIRQNIDTAPQVYRGMEGAPGHQAGALAPDGSRAWTPRVHLTERAAPTPIPAPTPLAASIR